MIRKPFSLYEPIRNGPSLVMPAYGDRKSGDCLLSSLPKLFPPPTQIDPVPNSEGLNGVVAFTVIG